MDVDRGSSPYQDSEMSSPISTRSNAVVYSAKQGAADAEKAYKTAVQEIDLVARISHKPATGMRSENSLLGKTTVKNVTSHNKTLHAIVDQLKSDFDKDETLRKKFEYFAAGLKYLEKKGKEVEAAALKSRLHKPSKKDKPTTPSETLESKENLLAYLQTTEIPGARDCLLYIQLRADTKDFGSKKLDIPVVIQVTKLLLSAEVISIKSAVPRPRGGPPLAPFGNLTGTYATPTPLSKPPSYRSTHTKNSGFLPTTSPRSLSLLGNSGFPQMISPFPPSLFGTSDIDDVVPFGSQMTPTRPIAATTEKPRKRKAAARESEDIRMSGTDDEPDKKKNKGPGVHRSGQHSRKRDTTRTLTSHDSPGGSILTDTFTPAVSGRVRGGASAFNTVASAFNTVEEEVGEGEDYKGDHEDGEGEEDKGDRGDGEDEEDQGDHGDGEGEEDKGDHGDGEGEEENGDLGDDEGSQVWEA